MKISFEEACKISKHIVTAKSFNSIGIPETMKLYKKALSDVGWTIEELCEESRNRLLLRITESREGVLKEQ